MDTTPQNALFHTLSAEQVASLLEVDLRDGLSDQQVAQRSAIYGANELREKRRTTLAEKFIAQFKDAMILILLAAAVIAGAIGEISDTVVILIIVILNATIGLIQEYRAERAVDALKRMTEPEARIRRGGHLQSIPSTQLVPGDVVSIEAGNVVWVGLFIAALSLGAQAWAFHGGSDNWQTIVFTVLTFSQLMHVLAIRSEQESLFSIGLFSNPALIGAILLTVSLQMMIIYVPFFNEIFHTSPLSAHDLLLCMLLPLVVFVAVEMEKYAVRQGWIYN
ncbi:cation transporting ATPase C-terminal domain-containing protein [Solemya velum gill symbiont]|uniref:cation transporting ATPase C-terminal domain-containing protein n=1 Tax=Solemya velum gill symbiont TaxID=2340 RepID=UPI000997CC1A|nr:cation-translocating P-type ATPase C-terminal domain-containing protein [Solemya velum gill symbiont]OOY43328.1 hypothetical protein BOV92_11550 [Solemya velum gill symbiont]